MSTQNRNNNNTNNKYVAPNKRQQPTTTTTNISAPSKSISVTSKSPSSASQTSQLDKHSFPTLKETLTSNHPKSFAAVAKKVEAVVEVKTPLSDVSPGWIHIRRNKNKAS